MAEYLCKTFFARFGLYSENSGQRVVKINIIESEKTAFKRFKIDAFRPAAENIHRFENDQYERGAFRNAKQNAKNTVKEFRAGAVDRKKPRQNVDDDKLQNHNRDEHDNRRENRFYAYRYKKITKSVIFAL